MLTARRLKSALSRGASPFAIPAVDSAHLAALEMPRLSVWLDRGLNQRLIDGEPAAYDDPIILVGGSESYEARCRQCHRVPRRDK